MTTQSSDYIRPVTRADYENDAPMARRRVWDRAAQVLEGARAADLRVGNPSVDLCIGDESFCTEYVPGHTCPSCALGKACSDTQQENEPRTGEAMRHFIASFPPPQQTEPGKFHKRR